MYSVTGECKSKDGDLVTCELLTSKGQDGGGVTFADDAAVADELKGRLFAIYTGVFVDD